LALEPDTLPDQKIGQYSTKAYIGGGGFAWVLAARRAVDGREVAVKVLKPRYAGDEKFTTRFLNEAETASQLRHPNIIRILDVGRAGEHVYFVMPRLRTSLDAVLQDSPAIPEAEIVRISRDISRALAFAHDTGIIHRDIKPQNILFGESGAAVLTDFGIARAVAGYTSQTGKQLVLGTPHYVSPEQARGMQLDGRTDLYALGVTMYRAATGDLPFRSSDWYELARLHVEEPPEPPRRRNPQISKQFEKVILRLMEKDRENRYPSAGALAAELDELVQNPAPRTTKEHVVAAARKVFRRRSG
jgi:serine/threonine protein kinase